MHAGDVIKTLRNNKKITQEELARVLGVEKSSIQKYESGKVQNLKLATIRTLCQYFEITPLAFIFPPEWKEVHVKKKPSNDFFVNAEVFFKLNEKGKKKVLEYINDIGQIKEYRETEKRHYK